MVGKVDIVVDVVNVVELYLKPSPGVVLQTQGNVLLIQNMVRRT